MSKATCIFRDKGKPLPKLTAIGITNQRETSIVWDTTTGLPLHNAIVWLDSRTSEICDSMACTINDDKEKKNDRFRHITGLPISTYFSSYKIAWLIQNCPAVAAAVQQGHAAFGTVDSWLIYCLTNKAVHVTDVTNASRTNLMDLGTLTWSDEMCATFNIPKTMLPTIKSSAEVYGTCVSSISSSSNSSNSSSSSSNAVHPMLEGIPISGCLGDQQAAMMGHRCQEHDAKCTYGTGAFLLLNTGPTAIPSSHGLLTTIANQLGPDRPPFYALEGSIAIAGAGISWLRDGLGLLSTAAESEAVARSVDDAGGVVLVPAFSGLLAPWWRDDARGVILGLSQYTEKAHIVRAMLEAIAFQGRDVLEAMVADVRQHYHHHQQRDDNNSDDLNNNGGNNNEEISVLSVLAVDGGASSNALLLQLQADIAQVPVMKPEDAETTAKGAALAAGIGAGVWTVEEVFGEREKSGKKYVPGISGDEAKKRHGKWKDAVERSFGLAT
jgi:glycerol kinase